MTVALECLKCGARPRPSAKFCDECGSPVTPADTFAEYKQVTVMFADVVRSMTLAVEVGPERWRELMTELVTRAAAVVHRYGGTVDQFTGDGILAVFGAPVALEDHALRACIAGLGVQDEVKRLAVDVERRDGVALQVRVGLNSGQVIAGEGGSGVLSYTAIGEQVGMAQRMESAAPPGGVMLSESTARLVDGAAVLGEPELVQIKNRTDPVAARRLLSIGGRREPSALRESTLVGREWELPALAAALDRSINGRGSVVGLVGPAGVGKTRLLAEAVTLAESRGVAVFSAFCESHATDIPFRVAARLLTAVGQLDGLDDETARERMRARIPDADPQDMLLIDDLLGIADPDVPAPSIDPDARRRRLAALIKAAQLARAEPALLVVEDVHWIDEASESMLADVLAVVPQTRSMMLVTYRPEYQGALSRVPGGQTIALDPLSKEQSAALVADLLGVDPSVAEIGALITARAEGNPLFVEEMVRDLAERGVLVGARSGYTCDTDVDEVGVPPTLQTTIAARIDRLSPAAKRTLAAAAVVGSHFTTDLLASMEIDACVDPLISADLVDQVRFIAGAEYAFRHALIRAVAYESQLIADRSRLHRRLAAAIEAREPESAEQNAALIAEHLEAAGDLHAAFGWQMRAGAWATNRDVAAAQRSWERARKIADSLPADDVNRLAMRIAPRTMLCGIAWRVHLDVAGARFEEFRALCAMAGDKGSLAIGMAGLVMDHAYHARMRAASELASEAMSVIESIGDPNLTVGLSFAAIHAKGINNESYEALQWSQRVIDLADGDPTKGQLIFGCPLALAFASRGIARYCLGDSGWREDLRHGLTMARNADPMSYATVASYIYLAGIPMGVLTPDDDAVAEIEDALRIAERAGDDVALAVVGMALGVALVHRGTDRDRQRGLERLNEVSELILRQTHNLDALPIAKLYLGREMARDGDHDRAFPLMRAAVDDLFGEEWLLLWGIPTTGVLVETLLDRATDADFTEAEAAIERLAAAPTRGGVVLRDLLVLRLRSLLARTRGDAMHYAELRDRYRDMATSLGFAGHRAWAEALP
ncbi:adenylate/guanylate cyclase domain-containing protein [Mycobacterium angelicum]|uniref:Cyclase n=1 Tax=Mycobacterium angelicum TaxID=470074 RepID=A0A1X0A0E6_MYCAN|nr:adenylate/guanylate cyclase domain-containing protein [Mycobacterium angelicum]MCV7196385.1 AAA family ATPase [Mycobacterium angelicum]ORA23348.1 cyclase [Mycobacterium angelicum]